MADSGPGVDQTAYEASPLLNIIIIPHTVSDPVRVSKHTQRSSQISDSGSMLLRHRCPLF